MFTVNRDLGTMDKEERRRRQSKRKSVYIHPPNLHMLLHFYPIFPIKSIQNWARFSPRLVNKNSFFYLYSPNSPLFLSLLSPLLASKQARRRTRAWPPLPMASISTLFTKTPNPSPSLCLPRTPKSHFTPAFRLPIPLHSKTRTHQKLRVSSALIEPDGGKLVELFVEESLRDVKKREALRMPRIKLSRIDLEWVHVLSEGWASPLRGFMRESEFLQTLHFNSLRLDDGSFVNMSVPIVLAIDDAEKHQIGDSTKVALVDSKDNTIAILSRYDNFLLLFLEIMSITMFEYKLQP